MNTKFSPRPNGEPWHRSPRFRYLQHKARAKRYDIPFVISFEDWWELWAPHWDKRGRCNDCKVMARFGDIGPYVKGNVRIVSRDRNDADRRLSLQDRLLAMHSADY